MVNSDCWLVILTYEKHAEPKTMDYTVLDE